MTRATLTAALAARATPLDRRAVAASIPDPGEPSGPALPAWLPPAPGPFFFRVAAGAPRQTPEPKRGLLPDVRGENARDAAAALHAAGFRVQMEGVGRVRSMSPDPGGAQEWGTTVRLRLERSR